MGRHRESVCQPLGLDRLPGSGVAVDDHRHPDHVGPGLAQRLDRGQHRAAGGAGVLHRQHPAALDRRTLDPPLQAVGLLGLAHHERVQPLTRAAAACSMAVATGSAPRVRPPTAVEVPVGHQVAHHPADQRGGGPVQGDPAHVDVVVGGTARGQRHPPVHHGQLLDLLDQRCGVVGHRLVHGEHPSGRRSRAARQPRLRLRCTYSHSAASAAAREEPVEAAECIQAGGDCRAPRLAAVATCSGCSPGDRTRPTGPLTGTGPGRWSV